MGYYTSFNLNVELQTPDEQRSVVTIESIKQELLSSKKIDKTKLLQQLEALEGNGVIVLEPEDIIRKFRDFSDGARYAINSDGDTQERTKWYDYQSDLVEFSKQFPEWLFTLKGEGEESGDIWKLYVLNGKSQKAEARIVFDEFDHNKLS